MPFLFYLLDHGGWYTITVFTIGGVAYKYQKFISQVSREWKSKNRVPAWSGSVRVPFLICRLCSHMAESREWSKISCLLIRTLILLMRAPSSLHNNFPKASPTNIITLGVRNSNIWILGEHKYSVHCNNSGFPGTVLIYVYFPIVFLTLIVLYSPKYAS